MTKEIKEFTQKVVPNIKDKFKNEIQCVTESIIETKVLNQCISVLNVSSSNISNIKYLS